MDILKPVRALWHWLSLADYGAAKEQASNDIIARFGRRNVTFQNGSVIDRSDLDSLSAQADKAIKKLRALAT